MLCFALFFCRGKQLEDGQAKREGEREWLLIVKGGEGKVPAQVLTALSGPSFCHLIPSNARLRRTKSQRSSAVSRSLLSVNMIYIYICLLSASLIPSADPHADTAFYSIKLQSRRHSNFPHIPSLSTHRIIPAARISISISDSSPPVPQSARLAGRSAQAAAARSPKTSFGIMKS